MPQYIKYRRDLPCYKHIEGYFTPEEVDSMIDLEDLQKFEKATLGVGPKKKVEKKSRDSEISWIYCDPKSQWLFDKFGAIIGYVNHDVFMYDVDGFDYFQYTKYKKGQHYTWHYDTLMEYNQWERKISATIMLSDPTEYEGGEMEIITSGNLEAPMVVKPKKGDIIFFASWMLHRVKPIESGTRKSLVTWIMGKRPC